MKSKLEQQLDAEFEQLGIKPYVYHIRDGIDHEDIVAITLATDMKLYNRTITDATRNAIANTDSDTNIDRKMDYMDILDHRIQGDSLVNSLTLQIIEELQIFDELHQNYIRVPVNVGVAICNWCDQFSRKRGRIIAKGRLLKHLKVKNHTTR